MILAGAASGTKGSDDFAFVEKPTALSKFLLDTREPVLTVCGWKEEGTLGL